MVHPAGFQRDAVLASYGGRLHAICLSPEKRPALPPDVNLEWRDGAGAALEGRDSNRRGWPSKKASRRAGHPGLTAHRGVRRDGSRDAPERATRTAARPSFGRVPLTTGTDRPLWPASVFPSTFGHKGQRT